LTKLGENYSDTERNMWHGTKNRKCQHGGFSILQWKHLKHRLIAELLLSLS